LAQTTKGERVNKMDDLQIGQSFQVNTETEVDLRREPNMNPKTEDGKDNVILAIPSNEFLVLQSVDVSTQDGHKWYNVKVGEETGWVDSDFLQETMPPDLDGGITTTYTFKFTGHTYRISDENLETAKGQYLFVHQVLNMIAVTINGVQYFTTQENINSMRNAGLLV
jgi:hypothetical protein